MTELKTEETNSRPSSSCSFLKHRPFVLPGLAAQLIFWPLVAAGLTLDLWSKKAVFTWLVQKPGNSVTVMDGFLRLVLAENQGAAFGIAAGQYRLLVAVSVIALVVIFVVFLFSASQHKLVHIALAFFAAGVCGNLWDRIFNDGRVRDFIDVVYWPGRHWPAFNVADTMLCIAVGLLLVSSFFTGQSCQKRAQQHK